jgi:hypothetical protein
MCGRVKKQDKCVSRKHCEDSGRPELRSIYRTQRCRELEGICEGVQGDSDLSQCYVGIAIGEGCANGDCMLTCEKQMRKAIVKIPL